MPILETCALEKSFGSLHVTAGVDLALQEGEIHCLIGPNGAGKSTLFRLILGQYSPSGGKILFVDKDVTALKPYQRIRRGMSVKFQVPGVFNALSVRQNLQIAMQGTHAATALANQIDHLLDFLNLSAEAEQLAGSLSHGKKQWLDRHGDQLKAAPTAAR